jgi:GalNAc-alpha-(1->4)-GalNAc-alpha-(1->3)-diNAcBac-PP-undecaprenol alpha-1,4-N-acetyl-D-galactosaminyltransferase
LASFLIIISESVNAMKINFVISSLGNGGAERVLAKMANFWVERGHDVKIITFSDDTESFYILNNKINVLGLNLKKQSVSILGGIVNNIKRIKILRNVLVSGNPDIVISFMDTTNILTILSLLTTGLPLIVSERINPLYNNTISLGWKLLRWLLYPLASKIVIQTEDILNCFKKGIRKKCIIIGNPVTKPAFDYPIQKDTRRIIALGRLCNQKGFDILVDSFKLVLNTNMEWKLFIFGEGPDRSFLQSKIDSLDLQDKVILAGITQDPNLEISKSEIFVLSSRFEGFPNALCEAMACGIPIISTDCPSGPSEIVQDHINGLLVPVENVHKLAEALNELIQDPQKREFLGENAKSIVNKYSIQSIMDKWENVINEISGVYRKRGRYII